MRSAPFAPYPPFLLPMPDEAAVALAGALHERGDQVLAVNGALPAAERCAIELARLGGGRVEVALHTRLHELGQLAAPPSVPGGLVAATEDDLELVIEWFAAFMGDATNRPAGRALPARMSGPTVRRCCAASDPAGCGSGSTRRASAYTSPARRHPAVVRCGAHRVHPTVPARPRLGQQHRRRGVPRAAGPGRTRLLVHRPGEPDLEQDLHRPGLPASDRHGEPCHQPMTRAQCGRSVQSIK